MWNRLVVLMGCSLCGKPVNAFHEMDVINVRFDILSACLNARRYVLLPFKCDRESLLYPFTNGS